MKFVRIFVVLMMLFGSGTGRSEDIGSPVVSEPSPVMTSTDSESSPRIIPLLVGGLALVGFMAIRRNA